jgi:hypothetical protein
MESNIQICKPEKSEASIDVALWHARVEEANREASAIVITDDVEDGMAADSLANITKFQKSVEDERKSQVSPFNAVVKKINDTYKSFSDPLDLAIKTIKGKRNTYLLEKDRRIAEENRKRQEEFQKKIAEEQKLAKKEKREAEIVAPPPVVLETKEAVHTFSGTVSASKVWNHEVVDITALYKARPDLVKLEPKTREIKEATKNGEQIEGLRVFQEYSQRTR